MKEERNIALSLILTIITCGIYGIYWFIVITDETKEYSNDTNMQSGVVAFLLTLITCGIYGWYWAYQMGKLMQKAQQNNKVADTDNSVLYLVLQFLGLGIVNYCILQNDLNIITQAKKGNNA